MATEPRRRPMTASKLNAHFSSVFTKKPFSLPARLGPDGSSMNPRIFTQSGIANRLGAYSPSGDDNISAQFVKITKDKIFVFLCHFLQASLEWSGITKEWKSVKGIPIRMSGDHKIPSY